MAHISQIHRLKFILLPLRQVQPVSQEVGERTDGEPLHPRNTVLKMFPIELLCRRLGQSVHGSFVKSCRKKIFHLLPPSLILLIPCIKFAPGGVRSFPRAAETTNQIFKSDFLCDLPSGKRLLFLVHHCQPRIHPLKLLNQISRTNAFPLCRHLAVIDLQPFGRLSQIQIKIEFLNIRLLLSSRRQRQLLFLKMLPVTFG